MNWLWVICPSKIICWKKTGAKPTFKLMDLVAKSLFQPENYCSQNKQTKWFWSSPIPFILLLTYFYPISCLHRFYPSLWKIVTPSLIILIYNNLFIVYILSVLEEYNTLIGRSMSLLLCISSPIHRNLSAMMLRGDSRIKNIYSCPTVFSSK